MRAFELTEARPWKRYTGRSRPCLLQQGEQVIESIATDGLIETGKQRVFQGYFVRIECPDGESWLGEDSHSIRCALLAAVNQAGSSGWRVLAIGSDAEWRETGLSWNSGWGYHPDFEKAVHMLDPSTALGE